MFKFQWILVLFSLNIMAAYAANNSTIQSVRPNIRGSGREEIALAEREPPGYRRYEHSNAWDYRTNWSNDSDRFLEGDLDLQNDHYNYGTDNPIEYQNRNHYREQYDQNSFDNRNYHPYPNYYNSNTQNYYQQTSNSHQHIYNNSQKNPYGDPLVYGNTNDNADNYNIISYENNQNNSQSNNKRHRSWSYRYNWVDKNDVYLKGENQVAYNTKLRTDKQKVDAKAAADKLAHDSANQSQTQPQL